MISYGLAAQINQTSCKTVNVAMDKTFLGRPNQYQKMQWKYARWEDDLRVYIAWLYTYIMFVVAELKYDTHLLLTHLKKK